MRCSLMSIPCSSLLQQDDVLQISLINWTGLKDSNGIGQDAVPLYLYRRDSRLAAGGSSDFFSFGKKDALPIGCRHISRMSAQGRIARHVFSASEFVTRLTRWRICLLTQIDYSHVSWQWNDVEV